MSEQVYEIPVWETITASWEKISGSMGSFWISIGIMFAIMFVLGVFQGLTEDLAALAIIISFIGNIVVYLIQIGLIYMGINRAKGNNIDFKMMFYAFNMQIALYLVALYILQMLCFIAPMILGVIAAFLFGTGNAIGIMFGIIFCIAAAIGAIFIGVRLSLSIAYLLDAGLAPVAALKASFAATNRNFWNLIGLFLLQILIIIISAIPLGIGLIWTLPFGFICYGMIYQRLRNNA